MMKNIFYKEDYIINDDVYEFLYKFIMFILLSIQSVIEIFNVKDFNYFMKPFIIIMVSFFYLFKTKNNVTKKERMILYSLLCSVIQTFISLFGNEGIYIILKYILSVFYLILNITRIKIETQGINISVSQSFIINIPIGICFMFCLSLLNIDFETIIPLLIYSTLLLIYVSISNLWKYTSEYKSHTTVLLSSLFYSFSEFLNALKLMNNSTLPLIQVFNTLIFQISQILVVFNYLKSKNASSVKYQKIPKP